MVEDGIGWCQPSLVGPLFMKWLGNSPSSSNNRWWFNLLSLQWFSHKHSLAALGLKHKTPTAQLLVRALARSDLK
jgi:hypothetical protein